MINLIHTLIDLLKIESYTGREHEISAHVKKIGSSLKDFELVEENLTQVYSSPTWNDKPTLALYGHLDTVINQQDKPSFHDEDYVYGCGASDMKGGVAVMIELMKAFHPERSKFNLQFVFYDAEEGPYKQNGLFKSLPKLGLLKNADLALVLEPTNNSIQTGCLGVINQTIRFKGASGHSARPWEGDNAIHKAWKAIKKLGEFKPVEHIIDGIRFFEVCNATMAEGGKMRNVLPDRFDLLVNYRFPPGWGTDKALSKLREMFSEPDAEFLEPDLAPSGKVCLNNPILDKMRNHFNLKTEAKQAWTDIAQLTSWDIPAVNFGPGNPAEAHQANEKISIGNLVQNYEILNQFINLD